MGALLPSRPWRLAALGLLPLALAAALILHGPIPQDPAYHRFADARTFMGIPNAWNVLSNAPFALVGGLGLVHVLGTRARRSAPFALFFGALVFVAAGSGYYHLAPDDARLFWDRLPMTLGFAGLLGAALVERVSETLGTVVMAALLVLGPASALAWRATGDLRLYVLVQYGPLLAVPVALLLFPGSRESSVGYWGAVAWYAAAKLFEVLDAPMDELTSGIASGHPIKHVLAAAAALWIWRMLRRRQEQADAEAT